MDDATVAGVGPPSGECDARSGDVPLDRVVAAADMINHAVLTRSELDLAVQILEGSGLVAAHGVLSAALAEHVRGRWRQAA